MMNINYKLVGSNIAKLRAKAGMTQQQLASVVNVSHQAVSKWENGAALPDTQTLLVLSGLFAVDMQDLLLKEIELPEPPMDGYAPSNEPGFNGWLRNMIPDEAINAIKSSVAAAHKTAAELGERACEVYRDVKAGIFAAEEKEEQPETEAEPEEAEEEETEESEQGEEPQPEAAAINVSFERILDMAPFMSREKLGEVVLRLPDINDWESIIKIAPFLSRQTLCALVERCADQPADRNVLKRLAPFVGSDMLYRLICENLHTLDWSTVKAFAPFLKRNVVDELTEYLISGKMPADMRMDDGKAEGPAKEKIQETIQNVVDGIGSVVSGIGNAVGGIFTPEKKAEQSAPKPEARRAESKKAGAPSKLKDEIARAALLSENWTWINLHLFEISDTELLTDIAVKAVQSFAAEDNAAIAVRAAAVMNEAQKERLFDCVIEESAWEVAIALKACASAEIAGKIVEKAVKAEGSEKENAYLAVENFAPLAEAEIIEAVTQKAIAENNWLLINALNDAF